MNAHASPGSRPRFSVLAAACHDLRQPLHALRLFADLLRQHELPAAAAEVLGQLNGALGVLEQEFDELLDAARISDRGIQPQWAAVPLQALFDRVAAHARPLAFDKGLDLRFRGGQRVVRADAVLLERMLRNLVFNAVRYTEDGGVLVGCRPRADGRLSLEVWDSGVGMAADELARVFGPYEQGRRAAGTRGERGWGLGLSIVHMLASAQGMDIDVRSVEGRGTRFALRLPAADPVMAVPQAVAALTPAVTLAGCRIAVCLTAATAAEAQAFAARLAAWQAQVDSGDVQQLSARARPDVLVTDRADAATQLQAAWSDAAGRDARVPLLLLGSDGSADRAHPVDDEMQPAVQRLPWPPAPNRLRAVISFLLSDPTT